MATESPDDLATRLDRIRWCAEAGLSGYRNLDILTGYNCARYSLEAVLRILDEIDRADDLSALAKVRRTEGRKRGDRSLTLFPTDLRSIIRRLRHGPPDDHSGAIGPDAQMMADGFEAVDRRQDDLEARVRALEGCIEPPTGEPGRRPE